VGTERAEFKNKSEPVCLQSAPTYAAIAIDREALNPNPAHGSVSSSDELGIQCDSEQARCGQPGAHGQDELARRKTGQLFQCPFSSSRPGRAPCTVLGNGRKAAKSV